MYWATTYAHKFDSITRDFDNEFDFWTGGNDHPGETTSRGMTLVWTGRNSMANGSWMMRLAGTNLMPLGLAIDGVFPNGGVELSTDAGFYIMRDRDLDPTGDATKPNSITMLGMGRSSGSSFSQLGFYENQDDGSTPVYHLGLISSSDENISMYNVDPNCAGCTNQGQIIFGTSSSNALELGSGIGSNFVAGEIVESSGNVDFTHLVNINNGVMLNFKCQSCSTNYPFYFTMSSDGTTLQVGNQQSGGGNLTGINAVGVYSIKPNSGTATSMTFSGITSGTYVEGQKVWCHDCRAPSQATGAGTGRWIYKDSAGTWRSEDGLEASN